MKFIFFFKSYILKKNSQSVGAFPFSRAILSLPRIFKIRRALKFTVFCKARLSQKGQVIIEYILLLLVSMVMALVFMNFINVKASRNGIFFQYWKGLVQAIGEDVST